MVKQSKFNISKLTKIKSKKDYPFSVYHDNVNLTMLNS